MRLSPSDVYILSQETGPGFVIIDNFLERSKKLTAASVADAAVNMRQKTCRHGTWSRTLGSRRQAR